jgi:hypothetical protein
VASPLNFYRAGDVAMTPDGSRFHVAGSSSNLYGYRLRTTLGVAGALSGGPYSAISLQYVGGGVFMPTSAVAGSGFSVD